MYRDVRFAPISNFEGEMLHFIQHDNWRFDLPFSILDLRLRQVGIRTPAEPGTKRGGGGLRPGMFFKRFSYLTVA
jgi:hypothetical protein